METPVQTRHYLAKPEWERCRPGVIWAWWLGRSGEDAAALRRWQLWIWWSGQKGTTRKLRAIAVFLRGYLEAPYEALTGLKQFGARARRNHGIPLRVQYWQLLQLRWFHGMRPESYYRFQLFRTDRRHIAGEFVDEIGQILQVLCRRLPNKGDELLFLGKEEFRRWCQNTGIPTADNLLEVRDGQVLTRQGPLPPADLFVKPTNWNQGRGVSRWQCVSEAGVYYYTNNSGQRLSPAELEELVCKSSLDVGRPYIVQRALSNHPSLRDYTNGALSTIRLMTVRGEGMAAQPLMAAIKMPTGDAVTDNFDSGGVAVPIELDSGICGPGLRKRGGLPPEPVRFHPDSGAQIVGLALPFWAECLALACRAHDLVKVEMPVIGWDIAIHDDGPLIVEPNKLPCQNLAQMPGGFPLGKSPFAAVVTSQLRKLFLVRSLTKD